MLLRRWQTTSFQLTTSTIDMLLVALSKSSKTRSLWLALKMKLWSSRSIRSVRQNKLMATTRSSFMSKRHLNLQTGSEKLLSRMNKSSTSSKYSMPKFKINTWLNYKIWKASWRQMRSVESEWKASDRLKRILSAMTLSLCVEESKTTSATSRDSNCSSTKRTLKHSFKSYRTNN